jgi:hypothetical protein
MSQLNFSNYACLYPKEKKEDIVLATMADGVVQNQVYWVMGERAKYLDSFNTTKIIFKKC